MKPIVLDYAAEKRAPFLAEMYEKLSTLVEHIKDDLGPSGGRTRCHEVSRIVFEVMELKTFGYYVRDGFFGGPLGKKKAVDHSWIVGPGEYIIDTYVVGAWPPVAIIDPGSPLYACYVSTPARTDIQEKAVRAEAHRLRGLRLEPAPTREQYNARAQELAKESAKREQTQNELTQLTKSMDSLMKFNHELQLKALQVDTLQKKLLLIRDLSTIITEKP